MRVTNDTLDQFAILLFKQAGRDDEKTYTQTHMTLTPCQLRSLIKESADLLPGQETPVTSHHAYVQYQDAKKSMSLRLFKINTKVKKRKDVLNKIINQYRGNGGDHTKDGLKYSVALIKKYNRASAPELCNSLTVVPGEICRDYEEPQSMSIYNDPSDMLYYGRYVSKPTSDAEYSYYYAARTYNLHKVNSDEFQSAKISSEQLHPDFGYFLWTINPRVGEDLAEKKGISKLQHYFSLATNIMPEQSEESHPSNEEKLSRIQTERRGLLEKEKEEYLALSIPPPSYLELRLMACDMCIEEILGSGAVSPPVVAEELFAKKRGDAVLGPAGDDTGIQDIGGGRTGRKKRSRGSRNSRKSSRRVRGRSGRKKKRNRTNKRKVRSKTYKRTKRRTNKQSNRKTNKRSNRRYGNKNRLMVGGNYDDLIYYLKQSNDQGEITQRTKEEISKFFKSGTGASDEEHREAYAFIKQNYSSFLNNINSIIMETDQKLARNLEIEMSPTTRESREQLKPGFVKYRSEYAEGLGEFRREDPLSGEETGPPPSVSNSRGSFYVKTGKSRWDNDDGMDDPARDRRSLAEQLIISAQSFGIEMTEEEAMNYLRIYGNKVDDVIAELTKP